MEQEPDRQPRAASIDELVRSERYADALSVLRELETQRELLPSELVSKGRLIQLTAECELPLSAAKQAFRDALDRDPENIPAVLELAWYLFAVESMPSEAAPLFLQAIELSQRQLTEAAQGRARCIAELESVSEAASFLRDVETNSLIRESLSPEELDWLGSASGTEKRTTKA